MRQRAVRSNGSCSSGRDCRDATYRRSFSRTPPRLVVLAASDRCGRGRAARRTASARWPPRTAGGRTAMRHDRVGVAVGLQQRAVIVADLGRPNPTASASPSGPAARDNGTRPRRASELNVLSSTSARAPSRAARSTATAPPSDSPISTTSALGDLLAGGQPGAGGAGVGQNARLARLALAPAVAAVVEDQHRHADPPVQHLQGIGAMRDVAGVAVAEEHGGPGILLAARTSRAAACRRRPGTRRPRSEARPAASRPPDTRRGRRSASLRGTWQPPRPGDKRSAPQRASQHDRRLSVVPIGRPYAAKPQAAASRRRKRHDLAPPCATRGRAMSPHRRCRINGTCSSGS